VGKNEEIKAHRSRKHTEKNQPYPRKNLTEDPDGRQRGAAAEKAAKKAVARVSARKN